MIAFVEVPRYSLVEVAPARTGAMHWLEEPFEQQVPKCHCGCGRDWDKHVEMRAA